tara:strand:- start:163 stop:483 length:321 start_codon:yes stop_codon:yes gene_type:complete
MKSLKDQFIEAISKTNAFGEYLINAKDNDYLLVHCVYNELHNGIEIRADFCLPTYFSGDVVELEHGGFVVPFDPDYFDNIDHYFETCSGEIIEGYLIPNDLFCEDV